MRRLSSRGTLSMIVGKSDALPEYGRHNSPATSIVHSPHNTHPSLIVNIEHNAYQYPIILSTVIADTRTDYRCEVEDMDVQWG